MPLFLFISNALQVHGWELVNLAEKPGRQVCFSTTVSGLLPRRKALLNLRLSKSGEKHKNCGFHDCRELDSRCISRLTLPEQPCLAKNLSELGAGPCQEQSHAEKTGAEAERQPGGSGQDQQGSHYLPPGDPGSIERQADQYG